MTLRAGGRHRASLAAGRAPGHPARSPPAPDLRPPALSPRRARSGVGGTQHDGGRRETCSELPTP